MLLAGSDDGLAIAAEALTELLGGDHPFLALVAGERWDDLDFTFRRRLLARGVEGGAEGAAATLAELELAYGPLSLGETLLNRVGYDLLARDRAAAAVAVLERCAERYPTSWNAHDSLGEALAAAGDTAAAIASYRRSLELEPANANARAWLERLLAATAPPAPP